MRIHAQKYIHTHNFFIQNRPLKSHKTKCFGWAYYCSLGCNVNSEYDCKYPWQHVATQDPAREWSSVLAELSSHLGTVLENPFQFGKNPSWVSIGMTALDFLLAFDETTLSSWRPLLVPCTMCFSTGTVVSLDQKGWLWDWVWRHDGVSEQKGAMD